VNLRESDVRGHNRADARAYGRAERDKLDGFETRARDVDDGEAAVRVGRSVAVSGEVFGRGDDALALRALDEGRDEARHLRGVFAETADVDDGVGGVVVHVGDGRA